LDVWSDIASSLGFREYLLTLWVILSQVRKALLDREYMAEVFVVRYVTRFWADDCFDQILRAVRKIPRGNVQDLFFAFGLEFLL